MRRNSVITTFLFGTTMFGAAVAASDAEARIDIYVDKSAQQLQVLQNGRLLYVWPVSTGRDRFSTPSGVYTPERLERTWFSKAYYNSPMPHAIFFHNGYAIHGSYDIARLGGPASHGCVRLHPRNAALLFSMVQQEGPSGTTIYVGGDSNRARLRYRDDVEPWRPTYRRDESVARGPYRPDPRIDPGPPPRERPDRYVDRRGAYPPPPPPGPDVPRYYEPDRYYPDDPGRHTDDGPYPRGPNAAPYYEPDRSGELLRRAPRDPRVAPDYGPDPYVDDGSPPRRPGFSRYYPADRRSANTPDRRSGEHATNQPGPPAPGYADRLPGYADRPVDVPGRRHADPAPLAMRGNDPASRPPMPRFDGDTTYERLPVDQMPFERPPAEQSPALPGGLRSVTAGAKPKPGDPARSPQPLLPLTPAPTPAVSKPAPVPLPMPAVVLPPPQPDPAPVARQEPPPPQQESYGGFGYKVLPRSYWAGASWRWRMKRDEDSIPPPASPQ
jgi:L,D-transpeptidase catalytic domain